MKLELTRKDFLKSWSIAERFTEPKSSRAALTGVLVNTDEAGQVFLEASNSKTSVKCKADGVNVLEAGTAIIPTLIFSDMLKKAVADNVTVEINSNFGLLKSEKSKTKFTIISASEFPHLTHSDDSEIICTLKAEDLEQLIIEGSSASSKPADFPKYYGTCLFRTQEGEIKVVATDGKRLSLSRKACETIGKDTDLILPSPEMKELARTIHSYAGKDIQISANNANVWFSVEDIEFSIRQVDTSFPHYERILNDVVEASLKVNSGDLISALERVDIIAKTTVTHIMALSLNPNGEIKITARSPENGIASEEFLADINGKNMLIGFNIDYFMDGLRALGNGNINIEFSGEESQARMKRENSGDFLYMLMPARLSPQDKVMEEDI